MSHKIVPIDRATHAGFTVNPAGHYPHAKHSHLCRVTANEIALASMDYPVVLIREPNTDRYHCTALLGFENGENLYYRKPRWRAAYVPSNVTIAPFSLGTAAPDSNTLVPCINESSPYLSKDTGNALFDDDGKKSQFLQNAEKDLESLYNNEMATQLFVESLKAHEMLRPFSLDITYADGNRKSMVGMYMVSNEKLDGLSDAQALEFFRNGYLVPIYAMLSSLNQVHRMIEFRNEGNATGIAGFEFKLRDGQ